MPKVAIVHEYLLKLGGAERVTAALAEMYPEAPIYTLLYDESAVGHIFPAERVRPSNLQKLPKFIRKKHSLLLKKFPKAVESFDLSEFDVVISSSNSFAHGVVTNTSTKHICYYHSPMRYAWDWYNEYFEDLNFGKFKRFLAKHALHKVRMWDKVASERPDVVIANSKTVQRRIEKYYRRESEVIYPPVDVDRFKPVKEHEDFFLIVSALTPYKNIELAVEFFNKVGKKLLVVGDGAQRPYLESISGPSIEFKGRLSDDEVTDLMVKCRGFIFPGEEDFGIAPVEAMAAGRPVFALGKGGVTESVVEKETGMFFEESTLESFENGFAKFLSFEKKYFDPKKSIKRAEKFSREQFEKSIKAVIDKAVEG